MIDSISDKQIDAAEREAQAVVEIIRALRSLSPRARADVLNAVMTPPPDSREGGR